MLEDSMLGGDDDDDLTDLLEECENQVAGPQMRSREMEPPNTGASCSSAPIRGTEPSYTSMIARVSQAGATAATNVSGNNPGEAHFAVAIEALIKHSKEMVEVIKGQQDRSTEEEGGSKRKGREEVSYHPQEPVLLVEESYKIEDDAHEHLDTRLRQRLRAINVCPSTYWNKEAFLRVERPILGSSLYTEHLMPVQVHEGTVCKVYNRCTIFEIKNFLSSNSTVQKEGKKRIKVQDVAVDEFYLGVQTQWINATQVWEVVEAGLNFMAVEFMVRRYSHTALAMIRALHECRYFCGVAQGNPKLQRTLIESFFNECFRVSHLGIIIHSICGHL